MHEILSLCWREAKYHRKRGTQTSSLCTRTKAIGVTAIRTVGIFLHSVEEGAREGVRPSSTEEASGFGGQSLPRIAMWFPSQEVNH